MEQRKFGKSADPRLINYFFQLIIKFLNNKRQIRCIHKVEKLLDPDTKGKPHKRFLYGYLDKKDHIYISADPRKNFDKEEMSSTLLHEVIHVVMNQVGEEDVQCLEKLIWERFSKRQKAILKSYIPKEFSSRRPS
ncbi:MAG: hypothetical protein A3I89_00150 [Candidatus Harrisonbacteria bacterium RIFCSPLOWO2_02_FULL_41_11]|uniref:SprT-like domain-containing protein n=1 Tax=Candidatus Harrisonbacteria bacterium RIFCSPHIGHO2_02_FULL_42_16 TaxID=1798404 RepID=A0A1G1ZGP4_9BACT|nr:MAG: hypothetical protein A3B92_03235 [Candidatus Harrisonbacteria bacterium RIFCSPHIGHO2_02_FULL_42_16]OGY65770.1 MAG: hypothetical protein A3I89_00150 [Candidatus Harrisonbacteria bacterium RIFCSPLOWO2_02_FULL_41_11]